MAARSTYPRENGRGRGWAPIAGASVLIVSGDPATAQTLARLISDDRDRVIGPAATARDALALAASARPDAVILDDRLPDMRAAHAAAAIRSTLPTTQILVLIEKVDREQVFAALEAGATACASLDDADDEILLVLRRAGRGEFLVSRNVVRMLARGSALPDPDDERARIAARLTAREHEILALMGEGLGNRAIAARTGLSVNTVRMHVQNTLTKIGAHSKLEAVTRARQLRLLDR